MKLRNKKTGEIVELKLMQVNDKYLIDHESNLLNGEKLTLELLANSFDDVEEPLIKDEKIRKAVRAWGVAFNIDEVYIAPIGDGSKFVELFKKGGDGFERIAIPAENISQEQCYTIAELCGEEE